MPYYRLVSSGQRPELNAEEILLGRHEDTGEPQHSLSTREAREIPEELLTVAQTVAASLGYGVFEVAPPEDSEGEQDQAQADQETGVDAAGQAPVISETGDSGAEVDQQATQKVAPAPATSQTVQQGASASSAVSTAPPSNT